nr:MAG TPA: nucelotide kinase [Caudoviricetes sp.]
MSTTRKRPIEDPTEKRYVNVLGEPITTYKGLQFCQKCGQDLSEKICVHIPKPARFFGGNTARYADLKHPDDICLSSGLPTEVCGCEDCTDYRIKARATLAESFDGLPEQVKNIAESVVDHLKNLDPRVTGAEAAAAIKRQSADIRNAMQSTTLAEDAGEPEEDEETTAIKPNHYAQGAGGAAFDVIEALYQVLPWEQFKGYMKGNIIKYTVRYDAKNGTEDVEKAAEYNRRLMAYEVREGAKNAS